MVPPECISADIYLLPLPHFPFRYLMGWRIPLSLRADHLLFPPHVAGASIFILSVEFDTVGNHIAHCCRDYLVRLYSSHWNGGSLTLSPWAYVSTSVYLFWYFPKLRWVSYILFFLAFQFKIYPYVFILCFIKNWKDLEKEPHPLGQPDRCNTSQLVCDGDQRFFRVLASDVIPDQGWCIFT